MATQGVLTLNRFNMDDSSLTAQYTVDTSID
jgi:hypothetical protein